MSSIRLSLLAVLFAAQAFAAGAARRETRTLSLVFGHTQESITVTFKRDGQFDQAGLAKLNAFLRDWRREKETNMDPRLFDLLWQVHQETGSRGPIHIVSAFRSPETNAALRSRGRGVAQFSQHTLGKAIDFYIPDVSLAKIREVGLKMHVGGVGFYPTSGSPFVHLDTGGVRHWPRMTREQLARVFPDGKTLHVPSDGQPMAGYQLAAAEREAKRGVAVASAEPAQGKNFFSFLFGGGDKEKDKDEADDEEEAAPKPAPVVAKPAARETKPAIPVQTAQIAPPVDSKAKLPPPPAPRPAEAPKEAPKSGGPIDSLLAREKKESEARARALAALAPIAPPPPAPSRTSVLEGAPKFLTELAPVSAATEAARNATPMTFDKDDPAIRSAAGAVSANRTLSVEDEPPTSLYALPDKVIVLSFMRAPVAPGAGQKFQGPAIVSMPIRDLDGL